MTTTTERVHGLLRLDADRLVIQWRLVRKTDHLGAVSMRTDEELEEVREVVVPLRSLAGVRVRQPWWRFGRSADVVITAADLRALEEVAGEDGLKLAHPAELVLRVRRKHRLLAREFSAEFALARAELDALSEGEASPALESGDGGDPPR